ncbi:MAG: hypothetical protein ABIG42_07565, partial [bacterium]
QKRCPTCFYFVESRGPDGMCCGLPVCTWERGRPDGSCSAVILTASSPRVIPFNNHLAFTLLWVIKFPTPDFRRRATGKVHEMINRNFTILIMIE